MLNYLANPLYSFINSITQETSTLRLRSRPPRPGRHVRRWRRRLLVRRLLVRGHGRNADRPRDPAEHDGWHGRRRRSSGRWIHVLNWWWWESFWRDGWLRWQRRVSAWLFVLIATATVLLMLMPASRGMALHWVKCTMGMMTGTCELHCKGA